MATNEPSSPVEAMASALRAATRLTKESDQSRKLTPDLLASAIRLAALSTDKQDKLTPENINTAIKVSTSKNSNDEEQQQQHDLTPESLAIALKLATKITSDEDSDKSTNEMLAAMKTAIAMTQMDHTEDLATTEILSDALKLTRK
ncbi:hypothetical protein I4U23_000807 [Adineta vaga]|nr:hypothetical protein I4U23_000807 [Adineta vaga]